jgi:hypothetical protein
MKHWDLTTIGSPSSNGDDPQIISSADDGRHERAWIVTVSGNVEVTPAGGDPVAAGPGQMFEFDPGERHELTATTEARVLLLLVPWPGDGHPGAMTLEEKAKVRERAAAQAGR